MRSYLFRSVLAVMCCGAMSGCQLAVGVAGGAGGVAYHKGNLKEYLSFPVIEIYEATMATMGEEGLRIYNDTHDVYRAKMKFEDIDGRSVWVEIEASTREASEIKIRVGTGGDKVRASQLLEKIKVHLF